MTVLTIIPKFTDFPLSFGMVKFDGSLRPYYYLIKQLNAEFPSDAYIVSHANDAGTAIYGKDDAQKQSLLLLIPNFSSAEKTIKVNNLPKNATIENAIYYSPSCFNGTAHSSNYWCKLNDISTTNSTIPAYAVALIHYSLNAVIPVITWKDPTASASDITKNSATITWNAASTTYGTITYQVSYGTNHSNHSNQQTIITKQTKLTLHNLLSNKHYNISIMATQTGATARGPAKTAFTTQAVSTLKPPTGMHWYSLGPEQKIYYGHLWFTTPATGGSGNYQYTLHISPDGTTHERIKNEPLGYNILSMVPQKIYTIYISVKDNKTGITANSVIYKIQWT